MQLALVVATNRTLDFLDIWKPFLSDRVTLFIVEDQKERTCKIPTGFSKVYHYCWKDIDADLRGDSWIIPRRTSGIKSYGFYKAWQKEYDIIACLDDDCFPEDKDWEKVNIEILGSTAPHPDEPVFNTVFGLYPRGYPFVAREKEADIVLNVGGWIQYPDIDAKTELNDGIPDIWWCSDGIIPYGKFFPMCGMNIAFRREIAPIMYFGLQGKDYEYDRYDDIWCGLFAKAVIDGMGKAVHVGKPFILHKRASDPYTNLKKELKGYPLLDELYLEQLYLPIECMNWCDGMRKMASKVADLHIGDSNYFKRLAIAMEKWAELFEN